MSLGKYIIVEIIPDGISPDKGKIVQLSALKLEGLKLLDRFDYRLNFDKIDNIYVKEMVNYDMDNFKYVDSADTIMSDFKQWANNYKLLIIDNEYTNNFLEYLDNEKESIFRYLELDYSLDVIDKVIDKYNLEPSNYIVDLLYEALIYEENNRKE